LRIRFTFVLIGTVRSRPFFGCRTVKVPDP